MHVIGLQPDPGAYPDRLTAAVRAMRSLPRDYVGHLFVHEETCTFALDPEDACRCQPLIVVYGDYPVSC